MSRSVYIVDAFASRPFEGNAAGVITNATDLSGAQMQAIARELKQTETCFVSTVPDEEADFELRWFTPAVEVDLCGHATVAAYLCLFREGRLQLVNGRCHLRHLTKRGILDVWIAQEESSGPVVMMSVGVPRIQPSLDDPHVVAETVGLMIGDLDSDLPLASEEASSRLIVPVKSLERLLSITPDTNRMMEFGARTGYRRFTLVCRETLDSAAFMYLRHFAPVNGIPEDPVTGTAHGVVAAYLDENGLLPSAGETSLIGEQGHAVGRPGTVAIDILRRESAIADVRIGGSGYIVAQGAIIEPQGVS